MKVIKVKFIHHPENDILPKGTIGESIVYELSSCFSDKLLSRFWLQCHKCGLKANLGDHDSVEVIDGLVTISPSCDCPNAKCPAHYWIKNGIVT